MSRIWRRAHILALKYLLDGGESDIFNLGNGVGFTVREVIETARKVTGHTIPAVTKARRASDSAQLIASESKSTGYTEMETGTLTVLEDIIETAWKWHKKHPLPGEAKEEYNDLYGY